MSHIDHQFGTDCISNFTEFWKVDDVRIGWSTCHNQLRLYFLSLLEDGIKVQQLCFWINAIRYKMVGLAREADWSTMGQVTTSRQIHAHHCVAWLNQSHISCTIGLTAWVRLHIGEFGTKDFLSALNGQALHNIHYVCSTIITATWVAFSIFIGQNRTLSGHNSFRNDVFWSDQLDIMLLTLFLIGNGIPEFFVKCFIVFLVKNHKVSPSFEKIGR